jgi:hypothetical protein
MYHGVRVTGDDLFAEASLVIANTFVPVCRDINIIVSFFLYKIIIYVK